MHKTIMPISEKVKRIPQALSVYINQLVYDLRRQKREIIALSLGESFFEIPQFNFGQLDFNRGYHYSDAQGWPALRERIAHYYCKHYSAAITANNILISAGSKVIIFMCMQAILNTGDEVLIHEPAWLSYKEQAHVVGATVRFIPFNDSCNQFKQYFNNRTRLLILNNPNNPTGRIYHAEELMILYEECNRRGIYLLIDEAYSDFVLEDSFCSIAKLVPSLEGIIVTNSLSKNMGISGWRIGYVITNQQLLSALLKLNQHIVTCAPTILQQYLAEYFDEILARTLPQVKEVVRKRHRIAQYLNELKLDYLKGSATFYFFVETGTYTGNIHDLSLYLLLEKGIAVVPGAAYGETTKNFLRISIGTESEERIHHALQVLRDVLTGLPIDSAYVQAELARLKLPAFSDTTTTAPSHPQHPLLHTQAVT